MSKLVTEAEINIQTTETEVNILDGELHRLINQVNLHDRKIRELRRNKQNKEADKEVKEIVNQLIKIIHTQQTIIKKQKDIMTHLATDYLSTE